MLRTEVAQPSKSSHLVHLNWCILNAPRPMLGRSRSTSAPHPRRRAFFDPGRVAGEDDGVTG